MMSTIEKGERGVDLPLVIQFATLNYSPIQRYKQKIEIKKVFKIINNGFQ